MPATLTSTGTWTTLTTDLSPFRMGAQTSTANANVSANVPSVFSMSRADMATVPPEVFRFIELLQDNYGSNPGGANNARLSFWSAAALLRAWLVGVFDGPTATIPTSLAGQTRP